MTKTTDEKQKLCRIKYARKHQAITERKREIKSLAIDNIDECVCGCGTTKKLIYFKGGLHCEKSLNPDYENSIDLIAHSKSMFGSSAAEFESVW